ncbi:MAG: hypothetical protein IIT58_10725 [Treponema sp.]|nr:hypothetical protein [Treponema sp.]
MARSKNNYCDKTELNALVTEWIHSTNSGNGDWLEKWKTAAETKAKGKKDKLDDIKTFYDYRKALYEGPRNTMDPTREARLWNLVQTIVKNRIHTFNFKCDEDREDAEQDAFIAVFKYLNRYDTNRGSSVFAYITELISNGILLNIKNDKDSEWCRISLDNVLTERMCKHYYGDDGEVSEE